MSRQEGVAEVRVVVEVEVVLVVSASAAKTMSRQEGVVEVRVVIVVAEVVLVVSASAATRILQGRKRDNFSIRSRKRRNNSSIYSTS